jgi:DNA-binding SARP family transcriptional activator/tetratricopeptide (TPR) repeat protein
MVITVEFRILGPLEVYDGQRRFDLGGARHQAVLAMLLLSADRIVTVDRLLEAMYGEDLPSTPRSQVQMAISVLRRKLVAYSHADVILTREQGYVLRLGDGLLDSRQFGELVAAGRAAASAGLPEKAVASYRDAERLWRGPALAGLDSAPIQAAAARLDEQRIASIEDRLAVELDLGRHHELVGELAELARAYPLRERLRGQLMLALYRCDRSAEALTVYRQARQVMIEELGIEPGERLRQLQHAILTSDPSLDLLAGAPLVQPPAPTAPRLLPADIADFTGRAAQVEQIGRHLAGCAEGRVAAPVVVITGQGGVGKTSLAVHAAHSVGGQFPDGQLFADLHAGAGHPVSPMQVLDRFLRALGVPGPQVPEGLDERGEMYRNLVAGRQILIVLDDAAGESQVLPLLPGTGTAAVIVTSRHRLGGLGGAARIEVAVFYAEASLELLARIAGTGRVQAQPQAAAMVAGQCGNLPLALRVAGARLAERPHWAIQQLADRLADESRRLDELRHGDLAIRPSISLSYHSASEQGRRLLRLLPLVEAPVFSGWVAAALLGQPPAAGEDALDELVSARLVETAGAGSGVHSQYRLHDLIRVYARERLAAEEPPAEQKAALERVLGALLYLARQADYRYDGSDSARLRSDVTPWPLPGPLAQQLVSDPLAWFERERAALVSGVGQAARGGFTGLCWELAFTAATLFEGRAYFDDWQETHEIALHATRQAGDVGGQATILYALGSLHMRQGQYDRGRDELITAAQLFRDAGNDWGMAIATAQLAAVDWVTGRLDDAARRGWQALAVLRRTGDAYHLANLLSLLGRVKLELREFDDAIELLTEALRQIPGRNSNLKALNLSRLGEAYLRAGDLARAVGTLELALATAREISAPGAEAQALINIAAVRTRLGEFGPARGALRRALELAGTLGERLVAAQALRGLGELALASGDPQRAAVLAGQAAGACRELGARPDEARALALLGEAHSALGDSTAADAASAQAAALRASLTGGAPSRGGH